MGKIVRALSADGSVLCSAIDSTDIANEIFRLHKTAPVATAALGRLASAGSIMGAMLKSEDDRLTLRMNGGGPAGNMVVTADYMGNVKCYADNVNVDLPLKPNGKLDVSGYVGTDGFLGVIKDLGLKEPYATQVPIVSGEIAEDITSYYAISEQIPTVCALGVLVDRDLTVKCAGGFLIQLVPPINEKAIDVIENNIKTMQSVTELMSQGKTPEDIALMGLAGLGGEVLDTWECKYYCNCSRERTERILMSLGRGELKKLAEEQDETEVCCHFCDKKYKFTSEELKKLLNEAEK
ncbi:MAG: Hsp33 family molecular chaperone HslO [Ruminiclostridium sp.]|nr:Hsp33 family molecular chaperone HslO [Ruminiclostridium sp.]